MNNTSKYICHFQNEINHCENIYEIPTKFIVSLDKYKKFNTIRNCSDLKICKKTNISRSRTYYAKLINERNFSENLTKYYKIPFKFSKNLLIEPKLMKFSSFNFLVYYLNKQCKKNSLVYIKENIMENLFEYWQLSYSYEAIQVIECTYNSQQNIKCYQIKRKFKKREYFGMKIHCEIKINKYLNLMKISQISSNSFFVIFFSFILKRKLIKIFFFYLLHQIESNIRLGNISYNFSLNFKSSKVGYLQIYVYNYWLSVSNIQWNTNTIDLACQYFGYKSGTLIMPYERETVYLYYSVFCPENIENFVDCRIGMAKNVYLSSLKSRKTTLVCVDEKAICPNILNLKNTTVTKFLKKCFYIFNFKRKVDFFEMKEICLKNKLEIISLNSKDDSRFLFNKIFYETYNIFTQNKRMFEFEEFEKRISIPFCKF